MVNICSGRENFGGCRLHRGKYRHWPFIIQWRLTGNGRWIGGTRSLVAQTS